MAARPLEIAPALVVGIFVGGRGSRMGGAHKGLFIGDDGRTLVRRAIDAARDLDAAVVLVGDSTPYHAVAGSLPSLPDDPPGIGPLGGLHSLLAWAATQPQSPQVIAVSCDLPRLSADPLRRLRDFASPAEVVAAARRGDDAPWEPLFARYDPVRVLPGLREALGSGIRSFQGLFSRLDVERFPLVDPALLDDWDEPDDLSRP